MRISVDPVPRDDPAVIKVAVTDYGVPGYHFQAALPDIGLALYFFGSYHIFPVKIVLEGFIDSII